MKTKAYQSVSRKLGQLQKQKTFSKLHELLKVIGKLNKHFFSKEEGGKGLSLKVTALGRLSLISRNTSN